VILSDVEGLFTADPRVDRGRHADPVAARGRPRRPRMAGPSRTNVGTGGMASKIAAARTAAAAGIPTVVASGARAHALATIFDPGADVGTLLVADGDALGHRKHWIAHTLRPAGTLHLDAGAERAVLHSKRSLLPSGVRAVVGHFEIGDCVVLVGTDGYRDRARARELSGRRLREDQGCAQPRHRVPPRLQGQRRGGPSGTTSS
jgi:glutamate 5-kinase